MPTCTGGSQRKADHPRYAVITSNYLGELFSSSPIASWLGPFIHLLPDLTFDMDEWCAGEPPTLPSFDAFDLLNLAGGWRFGLASVSFQKLEQLFNYLIWFEWCECTVGITPSPTYPTEPADAPVIFTGPAAAQSDIKLHTISTKAIWLWNGTTHTSPPAGWELPGYDDSAWDDAADPGGGPAYYASGTQANTTIALGATEVPVAPGNFAGSPVAFPHAGAWFLLRWRFWAGNVEPARYIFSQLLTGGVLSSGTLSMNGGNGSPMLNTINQTSVMAAMKPNAENLLAIWVNSGNTGHASVWTSQPAYACAYYGGRALAPVVPPDECCEETLSGLNLLAAQMARIETLVTLLQRQAAPFGYIAGDPLATGATGLVELDVQGLIGVAIDLTTIPAYLGEMVGQPTKLFDVGYLAIGTLDGWGPRYRIDADPFFVFPPAMGAMTRIGVSLAPGVVATIRGLTREA